MKLTTARLAGLSMLCMVAGTLPDSASGYSHHYATQDYQVASDGYSITCIYDDLGYQMWNTGWQWSSYTYWYTAPYAYYSIHHWIYEYSTGSWVFEYQNRYTDQNWYY